MPAFTENRLVHILSSDVAWPCVVAVRDEEIRGVGRSRSLWKIPQSSHPQCWICSFRCPPPRPQSLKLKAAGVMSVYAACTGLGDAAEPQSCWVTHQTFLDTVVFCCSEGTRAISR